MLKCKRPKCFVVTIRHLSHAVFLNQDGSVDLFDPHALADDLDMPEVKNRASVFEYVVWKFSQRVFHSHSTVSPWLQFSVKRRNTIYVICPSLISLKCPSRFNFQTMLSTYAKCFACYTTKMQFQSFFNVHLTKVITIVTGSLT